MTITLKSRLGLGRDVSISAPLSSDDLAKQELTDQVTGLLNRYGLAYGLTRHTDKPIGVVFTDIGGFKNIRGIHLTAVVGSQNGYGGGSLPLFRA
jgi:GGDEF domain-containing protein